MVLTSHLLVAAVPALAESIRAPGTEQRTALEWALIRTPLHVVWGGSEAVIVFFVLSGLVLSLPIARGAKLRPTAYYPSRLMRLYLPVWGAVCLPVVAHALVEGNSSGGTWWLVHHTRPLDTSQVADSVFLLPGAGHFSVLWSLHWEVLFSLLLPLFLFAAWATRRLPLVLFVVALAVLPFTRDSRWASYLPAFMLGVVIAYQHHRVAPLRKRLSSRGMGLAEFALASVAVVGLSARGWLQLRGYALVGHDPRTAVRVAPVLIALGASAAVALALVGPRTRRLLERRPVAWAGSRSFSLYLVHEPIVVLAAFALGGAPTLPLLALVALAPVLLLTEGFCRLVERPSHALSRRVRGYALRPRPRSSGDRAQVS